MEQGGLQNERQVVLQQHTDSACQTPKGGQTDSLVMRYPAAFPRACLIECTVAHLLASSLLAAVLRVQTEAFQAANVALGQMRAAALPAPSDMGGVPTGVAASIPSTPEGIGAGNDATPPHLQVGRWRAD